MKPSKKWTFALLALAAGLLAAGPAAAWGGHGRSHVFVGFNFGFPAYYPAYYPAPYYYYPPAPVYYSPVVVQSPPVYTERQDIAPETQSYWYYCSAAKGYYPYVKDCPGGWQKVSPTPPG